MDRHLIQGTVDRPTSRAGWTGGAVFSQNGLYRYRLTRDRLSAPRLLAPRPDGYVAWVMLNPSTATATEDDATIRRCMNFTEREGFDRFAVVNLFAFRTPYPTVLHKARDPVGPVNDRYLRITAKNAALTVCAWGAGGGFQRRSAAVLRLLEGIPLRCLGVAKNGEPLHPLYRPADSLLIPYVPEPGLDP